MRCPLTRVKLCLVRLAAAAMVLIACGCGHGPGYEPVLEVEEGDFRIAENPPYELSVSLTSGGHHAFELSFGSDMEGSSVDVIVSDEGGSVLEGVSTEWDGTKRLIIRGPFSHCRRYTITVKAGAQNLVSDAWDDDVDLFIEMGRNPYDIDGSESCSADVALSPLFTEGLDAALAIGEMVEVSGWVREITPSHFGGSSSWYVDRSGVLSGASRLVRIPFYKSEGDAALANAFWLENRSAQDGRLLSMYYLINIWTPFDPVGEMPAAIVIHTVGGSAPAPLIGPVDAGDVNGDGFHEILLSQGATISGSDRLQDVYILPADLSSDEDLSLASAAVLDQRVGLPGAILDSFLPVGDLDGDGKDDLAAVRYVEGYGGEKNDWQVWVARGARNLNSVFYGASIEKIAGTAGREIVTLDSGSFSGRVNKDLAVVDMERVWVGGKWALVNPRINIFRSQGRDLGSRRMSTPDTRVYMTTDGETDVSIRALGDINGDGFEELAVAVTQDDDRGNFVSSAIYIMAGKRAWPKTVNLGAVSLPTWSAKILADDGGVMDLRPEGWDPKVGDINNDGYDDFVIRVDGDGGSDFYWFLGSEAFRASAKVLYLSDAAAVWHADVN